MSWWFRHANWYYNEIKELESNSNYRLIAHATDKTLVSSGYVVVRTDKPHKYPILIIYPDATPYVPPVVFLLQDPVNKEELESLAKRHQYEIAKQIGERKKIYYRRHQNVDGSLCILEADDLHSERAEIVGARATISRVRAWFYGFQTGRFPKDSREVELFQHFHSHVFDVQLLLSDSFLNENIKEGRFYFQRSQFLDRDSYFGVGVVGKTSGGVEIPSFESLKQNRIFLQSQWDVSDLERRTDKVFDAIEKEKLIEGFWWDIAEEPAPFTRVYELVRLLDMTGSPGFSRLLKAIREPLRTAKAHIYFGLRFPGRNDKYDWAIFRLKKTGELGALFHPTDEDLLSQLESYRIEAVYTEKVTEDYFHLRNRGRAERDLLKEKETVFFGLGALGSTIGTQIGKAGVDRFYLYDKGILRAHNVIRHECGLLDIGQDKTAGVGMKIAMHNPFVEVSGSKGDITTANVHTWEKIFPIKAVGISTIADDNVEAWINEMAIESSREMFYIRALRGGKAGRIFRVRPDVDACKECLSIYYQEDHKDFIKIDEDPKLPMLTNECNNPVRPGSAADLGIISSIASRLILDALQDQEMNHNHWIWTTEELAGLPSDPDVPFSLHQRFLPPHPKCRLCQINPIRKICITEAARETMIDEVRQSGDVETGGVLVGYVDKMDNVIVTDVSPPGPNAVKKSDWFERDVAFCQEFLERAVKIQGGKGRYVGEWHYHPRGTNQPSARDLLSMMEISDQSNYDTETPLMIIVSPEQELGATIHLSNGRYEKVELDVVASGDKS